MKRSSIASGWVREKLLQHAQHKPDSIALRYRDKQNTDEWSYRRLVNTAFAMAQEMGDSLNVNQRAILLMPGDANFIASLSACILSGVAAIPVHLTNAFRIHRSAGVIGHIVEESAPEYIFTYRAMVEEIQSKGWHHQRKLIVVDELPASLASGDLPDSAALEQIYHPGGPVYLQYSSGSTGKPKAVCNYDDNIRAQQQLLLDLHCRCQPEVITANWLPFYHDMGMLSGLMMPLLSGGCCNFMPPAQMVADPHQWLKLIEEYGANAVAAPDFVWALCNEMVSDEQVARLDLRSLKVAANAAEPIRADTMARFTDRFAPAGFEPQAFTPAYGMAESTLAITYKPANTDYVIQRFNGAALAAGRAQPDAHGRPLVSSGRVDPQWQLRIVDADSHQALPEGHIGEVWASGASKAYGYWNKPQLSAETFEATVAGEPEGHRYLRTGDLAFLWQGELYICGRLKDIIIVAGENHMPNDLEQAIEKQCEEIKTGGVCACQDTDSGEILLMLEARRHQSDEVYTTLSRAACAVVAEHFGLTVGRVIVLSQGKLKKTSSGKIQRRQMMKEWQGNELSPLFVWQNDPAGISALAYHADNPEGGMAEKDRLSAAQQGLAERANPVSGSTRVDNAAAARLTSSSSSSSSSSASADRDLAASRALNDEILPWLHDTLCRLLSVSELDPVQGLLDAGLSSLQALRLCQQINEKYRCRLRVTDLFAHPTLLQLSGWIASHTAVQRTDEHPVPPVNDNEVAIVAISCRLPGQQHEGWQAYADWLSAGESAVRHEANDLRRFALPVGALADIDGFDAAFFAISPKEAQLLDPQQRMLLELSWHLFEQAGWRPESLKASSLGVWIGQSGSEFGMQLMQQNNPDFAKSWLATGISASASSGRLAKFYGTRGPALTLDTGCSSSLVALNCAVRSLRAGQCSAAVVGGVNLLLSAQVEQALTSAGMLSPNGRCATFSDKADGYARGEGAVMMLLKPYALALRDGDPVLAVIESSVAAQDGESSSLTAPNPQAQGAMMRLLLDEAGCTPDAVSLLETHGTGTSLGDPVELSAVAAVYGDRQQPLPLGASKTQLGHLEAASGLYSVLRAVAQIQRQQHFGHPHFHQVNPQLAESWPRYRYPQQTQSARVERVAVNAFSFTGTMASALIKRAETASLPASREEVSGLLPVSGHSETALRRTASALADVLVKHPENAAALLNAWCAGREHHFPLRALIRYRSLDELISQLKQPEIVTTERLSRFRQAGSAAEWLNGGRFDWRQGREQAHPAALALLPLYPFDRQRHWPPGLRFTPSETHNTAESGNATRESSASIEGQSSPDQPGSEFVRGWVADTLSLSAADLNGDDDLLTLGLDSLQMLDLVDEGKKLGVALTLAQLFEKTTLNAWQQCWQQAERQAESAPQAEKAQVQWDGGAFTLTPVQLAYWRGRQGDRQLGGVACQIYLELDCPPLADERLSAALNQLHQRHHLLRMRINADEQGVIEAWRPATVNSYHWQTLADDEAANQRRALREKLSHRVADLSRESGFHLAASHRSEGSRLHINIDMVIADGMSVQILLAELSRAIHQPQAAWPALEYSFPQYLLEQQQNDLSASRDYWQQRLMQGLPQAPQLPRQSQAGQGAPRFSHRDWQLDAERWSRLKALARGQGVTPSMLLAGCYAATLRGWSAVPDFSLNLTIFNRRGDHPQLPELVADFTTLLLLACESQPDDTLLAGIRRLNQRFMADFDRADYSAVEVMRDGAQLHGRQMDMPVVFTSNLGRDLIGSNTLGELHYWISQTPQVWIDCQVMEHQGALLLCWDSVDSLFPPQMVEQMFGFMCRLIDGIASDERLLHAPVAHHVDSATLAQRRLSQDRHTVPPFSPRLLPAPFWHSVQQQPQQRALVDADGDLSYRQLGNQARELAWRLREARVQPGDRVAILLPKGRQQIVAVLACHAVGGIYVPLDVAQPPTRLQQIIRQAQVRLVVGVGENIFDAGQNPADTYGTAPVAGEANASAYEQHAEKPVNASAVTGHADDALIAPAANMQYTWLDITQCDDTLLPLSEIACGDPADAAYIIFTSGSTGVPKGVMVSHQAAANTVDEINRRYVGEDAMRVFALSALNFDLSVYDIFGALSCGGTLVIPAEGEEKDAPRWLNHLHQQEVTHWNSVPALFDMLLTAAEHDPRGLPPSLNRVMLSGDWVGLDLLPRLRALGSQAGFTALGGATEAAIWSNALDVEQIDPQWQAIPYGYPLAHQFYRVVDRQGRDCPDWVAGELWIGGVGLAMAYYGDEAKTAASFVIQDGERFYRTGDRGRFVPGGCLEFLGREDRQIKLNGYRIELGDIEAQAERFSRVGRAVAIYLDKPHKHLRLFVEGEAQRETRATATPAAPLLNALAVEETAQQEAHAVRHLLCQLLTTKLGLAMSEWHQPDALLAKAQIAPRYRPLVRHWLSWLVGQGCLISGEQGVKAGQWPGEFTVPPHPYLAAIVQSLQQRLEWIAGVVRGEQNALALLDDPVLSPETLVAGSPETQAAIDAVVAQIAALAEQLQRPVRVAELNGRSGLFASALLAALPESAIEYCLVESASSLRQQAEFRLSGYPHRSLLLAAADPCRFSADVVLSNNALHRFNNIATGVQALRGLCAADSHALILETLTLSPLAQLTVLLLPQEAAYADRRRGSLSPLLSADGWHEALAEQGMTVASSCAVGTGALLLQSLAGRSRAMPDAAALRSWLQQQLPAYMLPQQIHLLEAMPLSANGKVDRRELAVRAAADAQATGSTVSAALHGEREHQVAAVWQQVLGVMPDAASNFFQLGGDSLHATRIVAQLGDFGIGGATLGQLFASPVLRDFVGQLPEQQASVQIAALAHDAEQRYQPFAATDVQHAYLTGRQSGFDLGGVATHYYSEYQGDAFDAARLEQALSQLVARHDALRLIFDEQGMQRVLPEQPGAALTVLRCPAAEWPSFTEQTRENLSHRVLAPGEWPLFHATLIESDDGQNRFCLGLDNLVLDGLSMQMFIAELAALYADPQAALPAVDIGFRDYVTAVHGRQRPESEQYWLDRLENLPDAPALPLACDPRTLGTPRFRRRNGWLSAERWQQLTAKARRHQITPSCLLLTCYAQVLARWSASPSLSINVTLFDRQPVHPAINHVMGDFTSLLLLACHHQAGESWQHRARQLQQQLGDDLAHMDVSAVWVMRELSRLRGSAQTMMPVVFTSALGAQNADYPQADFPPSIWGVSQTPQVWIDHQVFERGGELHFNWDVVEGLFPAGMVDEMFAAYGDLLRQLSESESWDGVIQPELPAPQRAARHQANGVTLPQDPRSLHGRVADAMREHADRTALIDGERQLSFRQLELKVQRLALALLEQGAQAGEHIGVALPRGSEQVIAVLAVQWIGAAYVPMAVSWPLHRRQQIVNQAAIRRVISGHDVEWPSDIAQIAADARPLGSRLPAAAQVEADALAYIIFTSGSTGTPKGVAVTHAAAVNTLVAINQLYGVTERDRGLALSALHFDLSVWDIFGLLSAGGTLVTVSGQDEKDAWRWLALGQEHRISLWNSVPALLEMVLPLCEMQDAPAGLADLRLVMLSGDWVSPTLAQRLQGIAPQAQAIALGGATEASVWSNHWPMAQRVDGCPSVPYGVPLPNQAFRVVNDLGDDCPDWVPGELWIGGCGVAAGYFGDEQRTACQFVTLNGQRWYRTGDIGRWLPGAVLEFLGRRDNQVKVSGYRLELDEIRLAIASAPAVNDALVWVAEQGGRPALAAVVQSAQQPDWRALAQHLASLLPAYAIPSLWGYCESWPLTDNGKRDRRAIEALAQGVARQATDRPLSDAERQLIALLAPLLERDDIDIYDNFFAIGGDSFIATRLAAALRREHGTELPLWQIFQLQTLDRIAEAVASACEQASDTHFEEGTL
ncbi:non-ribosomal peptide synthetase [Erwinia sp. S38]|uniref:non-ribosomal peptide synthetase n=1 Tax=Erwinia sp. S38 TaxID=2769338 RepID=UPI00190969F1|nr:non-ribosomal peptide synthetase [Erwinia sp. S38]MBK0002904.1 amino acid adenylation domain-containing protein [Erwinia sp. S38]